MPHKVALHGRTRNEAVRLAAPVLHAGPGGTVELEGIGADQLQHVEQPVRKTILVRDMKGRPLAPGDINGGTVAPSTCQPVLGERRHRPRRGCRVRLRHGRRSARPSGAALPGSDEAALSPGELEGESDCEDGHGHALLPLLSAAECKGVASARCGGPEPDSDDD